MPKLFQIRQPEHLIDDPVGLVLPYLPATRCRTTFAAAYALPGRRTRQLIQPLVEHATS
jgi:hypothetical protein